jgi:hypothetical protein
MSCSAGSIRESNAAEEGGSRSVSKLGIMNAPGASAEGVNGPVWGLLFPLSLPSLPFVVVRVSRGALEVSVEETVLGGGAMRESGEGPVGAEEVACCIAIC